MAKTPYGVAGFDSSAALLQALASSLDGKGFPALGHSRLLEYPVRFTDLLPVALRRQIYAAATGLEGVSRRRIDDVDMDRIAGWAAASFPDRRYPAVFIGSSNGALVHLAALLGLAWLPQTFLVPLRRKGRGVDQPKADLEQARAAGKAFVAANPGIQLHQMHDPSQDRLSLQYITYFRTKYRRLPPAYRQFLQDRLAPGGTVVLVDCRKRWPTTRVGERYVFQFGAVGGMEPEEYLGGSERVAEYLHRHGVGMKRWDPPEPDGDSPEAEWGFAADLSDDVEELARQLGLRVLRLEFEEPDDFSPPVADFHRHCYRQRGLPAGRLLVGSFVLVEPHWTLRTGSVPYWATFNAACAFDHLKAYLDRAEPYDDIRAMIFPHGTESVALPALTDWHALLERARESAGLLGVNERTYPNHFSALARYHPEVARLAEHHPAPPPVPLGEFERFCAGHEGDYAVRLAAA